MKTTVVAPANIAFIKYWGKRSSALRIPLNDSISMNLSEATTTTTVEFSKDLQRDTVVFQKEMVKDEEVRRITKQLDRIRKKAGCHWYARVETKNSFPKGTGIASSASGFAALTVAAATAIGLTISERELTVLARLGSGSACRSIPDGFVWWHAGKTSRQSYAESLYPSTWWEDIRDIVCVISKTEKAVSSTSGMDLVRTSPLYKLRLSEIPEKIEKVRSAMRVRNLRELGKLIEEDAISMHCVMMTQNPPLFYWNEITLRVLETIFEMQKGGMDAFFTLDAGPNVHVICDVHDKEELVKVLRGVTGVQSCIVNKSAAGARYARQHLF